MGMRRRVGLPEVGLNLDDAGADLVGRCGVDNQQGADQVAGNLRRAPGQARPGQPPGYRRTSAPQRARRAAAMASCTVCASSDVSVRSAAR